jgi:hypothetical protein
MELSPELETQAALLKLHRAHNQLRDRNSWLKGVHRKLGRTIHDLRQQRSELTAQLAIVKERERTWKVAYRILAESIKEKSK